MGNLSAYPPIPVYLGVDGGGTFLRAILMSENGEIIASAVGDTASIISVGEDKALSNLHRLLIECLCKIQNPIIIRSVFALAGVCTRTSAERMYELFDRNGLRNLVGEKVFITSDTLAALWDGANALPAVVVVSGTGSHCLGINDSGSVARSLGLDYILSDEGSSYYLGNKVLRAVTQACDGTGESTVIKDIVFSHLGIINLSQLFDYIYSVRSIKQEVARFGRFAIQAAQQNDAVAFRIMIDAIDCLVKAAYVVCKKLDILEREVQMITVGGVFENNSFFRDAFIQRLSRVLPNISVSSICDLNSARGAAKMALSGVEIDIWSCYE